MGSPVSGRVAHFCSLDRNEGFFRSSILSCLRDGVTLWVECVFLPLDRNEVCFGYLVGIPSGWWPPLSGLDLTI